MNFHFQAISSTIGKSFRLLFKEVPTQWQIPVFIALCVITCLLIMRFRTGMEAIRAENNNLREQIALLKIEMEKNRATAHHP